MQEHICPFLSEQIESVKKIGPLPLCIGWNISGINGPEVWVCVCFMVYVLVLVMSVGVFICV